MSGEAPKRLAEMTSPAFGAWLAAHGKTAALVPVGSTEPHGPHLPLATDVIISEAAAERALGVLAARGVAAVIAPSVPYGVTDFAAGFAGAITIAAPALVAFLRAICDGLLAEGFSHVCLVNNHLEPAHDRAVRAAIEGLGARASVACPLTRRWARTLTAEFKSGACHAGRYETSIVLAATADLVDRAGAAALPDVSISLSDGIAAGHQGFRAMGIEAAYTGAPREATSDEGERTLALLAEMIATEVSEALGSALSRHRVVALLRAEELREREAQADQHERDDERPRERERAIVDTGGALSHVAFLARFEPDL